MFQSSFISNPIIQNLLVFLAIFFTPIMPFMIAIGVLIIIDTICGVLGAKKQGDDITSKKLGRVITKALVYQLLIISSHIVEVYLFPVLPLIKITLGFLAMTEFLSISENFQKVTGKNFIKYIREYLDTKFRGMIKPE